MQLSSDRFFTCQVVFAHLEESKVKKNKVANLIMVVIIAAIAAVGVLVALNLYSEENNNYGSEYQITQIPENRLVANEGAENLCTITIRCDTVFDNEESLDMAKAPYIPEDGEILPVTTVEFSEGDTVFDVLERVCQAAGLQIEYNWTPLYDSYYVEGINHLYEFDCGFESGWMFKVNDWFPNYGSSDYEVRVGDEIVWCYTCVGHGTDVGAQRVDSQ